MQQLAFLNLGPAEIAILLILFLMLFGVDKVPEVARSLGRARAELQRAQEEVSTALQSEEEREASELLAFEREREATIAREGTPRRERLVLLAMKHGIDPDPLDDDALAAAVDAAEAAASPPLGDEAGAAEKKG